MRNSSDKLALRPLLKSNRVHHGTSKKMRMRCSSSTIRLIKDNKKNIVREILGTLQSSDSELYNKESTQQNSLFFSYESSNENSIQCSACANKTAPLKTRDENLSSSASDINLLARNKNPLRRSGKLDVLQYFRFNKPSKQIGKHFTKSETQTAYPHQSPTITQTGGSFRELNSVEKSTSTSDLLSTNTPTTYYYIKKTDNENVGYIAKQFICACNSKDSDIFKCNACTQTELLISKVRYSRIVTRGKGDDVKENVICEFCCEDANSTELCTPGNQHDVILSNHRGANLCNHHDIILSNHRGANLSNHHDFILSNHRDANLSNHRDANLSNHHDVILSNHRGANPRIIKLHRDASTQVEPGDVVNPYFVRSVYKSKIESKISNGENLSLGQNVSKRNASTQVEASVTSNSTRKSNRIQIQNISSEIPINKKSTEYNILLRDASTQVEGGNDSNLLRKSTKVNHGILLQDSIHDSEKLIVHKPTERIYDSEKHIVQKPTERLKVNQNASTQVELGDVSEFKVIEPKTKTVGKKKKDKTVMSCECSISVEEVKKPQLRDASTQVEPDETEKVRIYSPCCSRDEVESCIGISINPIEKNFYTCFRDVFHRQRRILRDCIGTVWNPPLDAQIQVQKQEPVKPPKPPFAWAKFRKKLR